MSIWSWALIGGAAALAAYALVVVGLLVAGRRTHARALAGFVPDCALLFRGLAADPRIGRRQKLLLVGLAGYLASPIDLVPQMSMPYMCGHASLGTLGTCACALPYG